VGLEFLLDPFAERGGLNPSVEVVVLVASIECMPLLERFGDNLKLAAVVASKSLRCLSLRFFSTNFLRSLVR
jgi:hypothetical protein